MTRQAAVPLKVKKQKQLEGGWSKIKKKKSDKNAERNVTRAWYVETYWLIRFVCRPQKYMDTPVIVLIVSGRVFSL